MKNKIEDLRNHLFAQMEKLSDCPNEQLEQEIQKTSSMVQLAETIIDSARAENEFLSLTKGTGSGFIPTGIDSKKQLPEQ